jgi:hypothetical protein
VEKLAGRKIALPTFIFQILYGGKSGELDPQCVVHYLKVIFPFFHCTVLGFYFPNTVAWKNGKEAIFPPDSIQILFS